MLNGLLLTFSRALACTRKVYGDPLAASIGFFTEPGGAQSIGVDAAKVRRRKLS